MSSRKPESDRPLRHLCGWKGKSQPELTSASADAIGRLFLFSRARGDKLSDTSWAAVHAWADPPQSAVICVAPVAIVVSSANHFNPLAPANGSGPAHAPCDQSSAWHTPQLRVLLIGSWPRGFMAVVEPVLISMARHRLRGARDAEAVIAAVLTAFLAFHR